MGEYLFETVKDKEVPLAEQVAEQIRQLIIDRQLTHGEKLPNEFELAQQLNVGRGTVREAVKLLVARNVLEIRRGRGTFVARHTASSTILWDLPTCRTSCVWPTSCWTSG